MGATASEIYVRMVGEAHRRLVRDYPQDARPDIWYSESLGNSGALYIGLVSWQAGV